MTSQELPKNNPKRDNELFCLYSECTYRIYSNKRRTPHAFTADNFALVIIKLSVLFHRLNFYRNLRFTINLVKVHRQINR